MGWKTVIGCGQSGNDTVDISSTQNNGGNPFTAYGPIGSSICTSSWESAGGAAVGSYAIGQMYNNCPHTASGMTITAGGSISTQLSANLVHQIVFGPTGSPTLGNQIAQFLANTTYASGQTVTDASHSDAIPGGGASGNNTPIALSQGWTGAAPGTGRMVFTGAFWQADQPGGACIPFNTGLGNSQTGEKTYNGVSARFIGLGGATTLNTAIGSAQTYMPVGGTWSFLHINMREITGAAGPSGTSHADVKSCVNSTYNVNGTGTGNQVCSVDWAATMPQLMPPDISHTDAVPAGSYINFQLTNNIASNNHIGYSGIGSTWTSSQQNAVPMTSSDVQVTGGAGTFWRSQVGYMVLRMGTTGGPGPGSVVAEGPCNNPTAGTYSQMNLIVFTANAASTGQAYSLVANAQGNQIINPFGTTTGLARDVSHSDAIVANTSFQYGFTNFDNLTQVASQAVAFTTPMAATASFLTNDGLKQQAVEGATGTALTYNGDWEAEFDTKGIAAGPFNQRMLAWVNAELSSSYTDLTSALDAFAISQGAPNWSSLGTFTIQ